VLGLGETVFFCMLATRVDLLGQAPQVASTDCVRQYLKLRVPSTAWEETMKDDRARALLNTERKRVEALLGETVAAGQEDRAAANEPGDFADPAERLSAEEVDDALSGGLRERLAALDRAERRLDEGTFGYSIRSGLPIPEDRLEADPAAELTVEEASREPGQ
jgi:DnaK suppressor protein